MSIKIFTINEMVTELNQDIQRHFIIRPYFKLGLILPAKLSAKNQELVIQGYQESMQDWLKRTNGSTSPKPVPINLDRPHLVLYQENQHQEKIYKIFPIGVDTPIAAITFAVQRPKKIHQPKKIVNRYLDQIVDDWYNTLIITHLMKYLDINLSAHDIKPIILKSLVTKNDPLDPFNQYISFQCKLNHFQTALKKKLTATTELKTLSSSQAPIYHIQYNHDNHHYQLLTKLY